MVCRYFSKIPGQWIAGREKDLEAALPLIGSKEEGRTREGGPERHSGILHPGWIRRRKHSGRRNRNALVAGGEAHSLNGEDRVLFDATRGRNHDQIAHLMAK
ncbi:hypothetical protein KTAU_02440 [Thermogemmatispora aurantia]|uniref:Uncharacterized protein n=1 Tax=Thermogemmatispora aurantia TaxID=2045279 RepID=A0A5J4K638_9CHLR|nr:hypothetical protein KTAU_02440 [Thermogemmatispora aurantia]